MLDLLFFECDGIRYAVPASDVESIVWLPLLSPIDGAPAWCAGHLNWHGVPVPVIDLGRFLGHPPRPYVLTDRLIILNQQESVVAILVSNVDQMRSLNESQIAATLPPEQGGALPFRAELRDDDQLVMLLDVAPLMRHVGSMGPECLPETSEPLPADAGSHGWSTEMLQQFRERAHRLAAARGETGAVRQLSYAQVRIGERRYAIPLAQVVEFAHLRHYAPLPGLPLHIVGCMNLRGEVVGIVDLERFLKSTSSAKGTEVVVLSGSGKHLAIRIGGVERMIDSDADAIRTIGETDEQHPLARQLLHLPDSVTAILDVDALLKGDLLDVFEQI